MSLVEIQEAGLCCGSAGVYNVTNPRESHQLQQRKLDNALRERLPLLAALAANAPFYEGRDSGLASVRPKLGELLPRTAASIRVDADRRPS